MSIAHSRQRYIPAAGYHWLLPGYDALAKLMGVERTRSALLEDAELQPSQRVLDVGCGTGTLAVLIKRAHPDVEVVGIDPDPGALTRAGRKASRAAASIRLDQGTAGALPYEDGAFDRVVSSFLFHHLPADEKARMLREVRRVLAPGGRFAMVDFAGPGAPGGLLARALQSHPLLRDNRERRILALMSEAGLRDARLTRRRPLRVGAAAFYGARRDD